MKTTTPPSMALRAAKFTALALVTLLTGCVRDEIRHDRRDHRDDRRDYRQDYRQDRRDDRRDRW